MSLFGTSSLFNTNNNSLFSNTNNNSSLFGNNIKPKRNNNTGLFRINNNKPFKKCIHSENYCAFCPKDQIGLICYDCIFEYNISNCVPIKQNIEYYKELSKNYINEIKDELKDKLEEYFKDI